MNKGLLIFVLLIPALAALGYDAYVFYENQEEGFKLSDLGWLWTTYHMESHDYAYQEIGEESWRKYVVPILSLPCVVAALIFAAIILMIVLLIQGLSSLGSGKVSGHKKKGGLGRERSGSQKKFSYKRK